MWLLIICRRRIFTLNMHDPNYTTFFFKSHKYMILCLITSEAENYKLIKYYITESSGNTKFQVCCQTSCWYQKNPPVMREDFCLSHFQTRPDDFSIRIWVKWGFPALSTRHWTPHQDTCCFISLLSADLSSHCLLVQCASTHISFTNVF